jgi:hypothetical protein
LLNTIGQILICGFRWLKGHEIEFGGKPKISFSIVSFPDDFASGALIDVHRLPQLAGQSKGDCSIQDKIFSRQQELAICFEMSFCLNCHGGKGRKYNDGSRMLLLLINFLTQEH